MSEGVAPIAFLRPISRVRSVTDILVEESGSQYLLLEAPLVVNSGGNVFIMSE